MIIHGITPGIMSNTGANVQVLVIYFPFYNIMLSKLSSYHWLKIIAGDWLNKFGVMEVLHFHKVILLSHI